MKPTFKCNYCSKDHSYFETLSPNCLAAIKVPTPEEIEAALKKGQEEAIAFIEAQPTMPGYYK